MATQTPKALPQDIQWRTDAVCDGLIELEKKDYNNALLPFAQYQEKIRLEWNKMIEEVFSINQNTQILVKNFLQKEEKENPKIPYDGLWSAWEVASNTIRAQINDGTFWSKENSVQKPLHEQYGISWNFIDRVYDVGESLLADEKYKEAVGVFGFLIFLNPLVPEYWLRMAGALYGAENFEGALQQYVASLVFDPENSFVFFEMARCYCKLKEAEPCLACLEACIEYGAKNEQYADLVVEARTIKEAIHSKQLKI
jgi:tetratricopeptide (TPR) repeat protein